MDNHSDKHLRFFKVLFLIILLAGLGLRLYQFLMGRSLWDDETHLALNFMKYGYRRLAHPMDYLQAAPILYIYATKTFGLIFHYTEAALRAVPFIWCTLTLPLFYYIVLELTGKRAMALIAFLMFSVNLALIYFSSEVKPYGVDVSVYLLLVYLAVSRETFVAKNRDALLAIAGCVAILFSNVAFIVMISIGGYMLLGWLKARRIKRGDIMVLVCWGVVFIANFFLFIYKHPSAHYQRELYAFAFCPRNVMSPEFIAFGKKTIEETFFTMLLYIDKSFGFAWILLFIIAVGLAHMIIKRRYDLLLFFVVPIVVHLVMSALRLYPFWFRLILYLVPCFMFIIAYGTYCIADFIAKKVHVSVAATFVLICCFFYTKQSIARFPLWEREIRPTLGFINNSLAAHIYTFDPANAVRYYYNRGMLKDSVYQELDWFISPTDYYQLVSEERRPYILVYSTIYQYSYGDVLKDLRAKNLVMKCFEYKGYGVCLLQPLSISADSDAIVTLDYSAFEPEKTLAREKKVTLWSGQTNTKPVFLRKGKYLMSIASKGSSARGIFPHLNVFLNGRKIGDYSNTPQYSRANFPFQLNSDTSIAIKIGMDNDLQLAGEDRNTFIHKIYISPAK